MASMKLNSLVTQPLLLIFIVLAIAVLLSPNIFIPCLYGMIKNVEHHVNKNFLYLHSDENKAQLLHPLNSSSTNIPKILSLSINGSHLSIFKINNKVYALDYAQQNGLVSMVHKCSKIALIFLISTIIIMSVSIVSFGFIIVGVARREMHLCASLIKQMEATRQAETKSMNKSLAIASASHDIRASLAAITGLVEICYDEVALGSPLETNLKQMDACIKDLLGILNSFLDTSKIEAGKMQLEEDTFDVAQLVEDVVDLYHPVGIKKGVDVVLDPFDGSVIKFSHVKGDRGKLKQILCNLLSNAVKFTSEGQVTVRAWVRKPSLKNSIIASNQNGFLSNLCCIFHKNNKANDHDDLDAMDDPNVMDFVFEVDDTGKGIPKEKQKAVFENYVQVRETAFGLGGTGLGLGIVQSLVRLMHGEIGIVDKEIGEKGSCFRFNVLLSVCESMYYNDTKEENIEIVVNSMDGNHGMQQNDSGIARQTHSPPRLTIQTPGPRLNILTPSHGIGVRNPSSPKAEGSHVVLMIQNHERRRISQKFMESLGIKVIVVDQWERLPRCLKKITHKWNSNSHHSFSGKSDFSFHNDWLSKSASTNSSTGAKDHMPSCSMDGNHNYILSLFRKTHLRGALSFILLVIDVTSGPFSELCKIVSKFKSDLQSGCCKVVWLANPMLHDRMGFNSKRVIFDSDDIIKYKPFHGNCLYEVVKLLPEFGGAFPKRGSAKVAEASSSSRHQSQTRDVEYKMEDHGNSSNGERWKTKKSVSYGSHIRPKSPVVHEFGLRQEDKREEIEKPLKGKRILIAEDSRILGRLAMHHTSRLGATVELCGNGKEALELVSNGLGNQMKRGASLVLPYDFILMDCEMPTMDGYEATRQIRKMEESYGVHIPIIALTAYTSVEEASRTIEAGMNAHLCKPLKVEHLLEAIENIHNALPKIHSH